MGGERLAQQSIVRLWIENLSVASQKADQMNDARCIDEGIGGQPRTRGRYASIL